MQQVLPAQNPLIKEEPKIGEQSIISSKAERCGWRLDCPFCKNQDKEDWNGSHQNKLQWKTPPQPEIQRPQARCPETLKYQNLKTQRDPVTDIQVRQKSASNGKQRWKD